MDQFEPKIRQERTMQDYQSMHLAMHRSPFLKTSLTRILIEHSQMRKLLEQSLSDCLCGGGSCSSCRQIQRYFSTPTDIEPEVQHSRLGFIIMDPDGSQP